MTSLTSASRESVSGSPEFDYAPGQPNLFKLMRRKQQLVRELGVDHGFEAFKTQFRLPTVLKLSTERLLSDLDVARRGALHFTEIAPAGESFVHAAPEVIGQGNHRPIAGVTRSLFLACFPSIRLRGRSAVLRSHDGLLLDAQPGERERLDDELEWDPTIFHVTGDEAAYLPASDEESPLVIDEAFTLLGAHTDFFGHWMCEYLPRYSAARAQHGAPFPTVLIDACMPPSHKASLQLLYPDQPVTEIPSFRSVQVERLWHAPTLMYMPLHEVRNERFAWEHVTAPPHRFVPVLQDLQRRADHALTLGPAVDATMLDRKSFRHRKLVNAAEIRNVATEHGFKLEYPEDLDFGGQVRLLRESKLVLAPEGSAIFLAFFMRPGTHLCILSHPLTDVLGDYNGILDAIGVRVSAITGPFERHHPETPHDSDYRIDPQRLAAFLGEQR
jgi:capsular polysaccharide biosynthesis protein